MRPASPHVVVIDPGMHKPELASFNRLAVVSPLPLTYHLPAMFGLDSLHRENLELIAGLIIFGSASSVHDRLPWQIALEEFVKPLLEGGTPALGLCYGHQMIAHMFGGKVGFAWDDHHKAVGQRWIDLEGTNIWRPARGQVVVSHSETVLEIPEDFVVLGRSSDIAVEAMGHRSLPLWSFQSHPEATSEFLSSQGTILSEDSLVFGHELVQGFLTYTWEKSASC